jgi:hypothetical protein
MAIRRPSISSPDWLFQDFLYQASELLGGPELRYLQIKWDGGRFTRVSQSFDYSNPPTPVGEQRGGPIVGQVDYEFNPSTRLITIYAWDVNWRDEWPLRLAVNYLSQCLYPGSDGYTVRVAGNEVYTSAGDAIDDPNNFPYAFWVSEQFNPLTNEPNDYLVRVPPPPPPPPPLPIVYGFNSLVQITVPDTYLLVNISTVGLPLQTPLYWRLTGEIGPTQLVTGVTQGVILINEDEEFLKLSLSRPVPTGLTGTFEFYSDTALTTLVGVTTVTL